MAVSTSIVMTVEVVVAVVVAVVDGELPACGVEGGGLDTNFCGVEFPVCECSACRLSFIRIISDLNVWY